MQTANDELTRNYSLFQDSHVIVIAGIGFLMTFLKRYSWSSIGFNFVFAVFSIQYSILVHGFLFQKEDTHKSEIFDSIQSTKANKLQSQWTFIRINLFSLMDAEFSSK